MAFRRFSPDPLEQWNADQTAALRPHADAPLIHNHTGRLTALPRYPAWCAFERGKHLTMALKWSTISAGGWLDAALRDRLIDLLTDKTILTL